MANEAQEQQAYSQQPTIRRGEIHQAHTGTGQTKRRRRPGAIIARIALLVLFCLGFFLSIFPQGRAVLRTTLSLPTLLMASEPAPLTVLDEPVRHTRKTIASRNGPVYLDIYTPTTPAPPIPGSRGGVVMIPGIGDNRTVPQLINLSLALAHAGLVVVNMTTPTLISYNLTANDSDGVVQTFNLLAHLPGVSAQKIGLIGFSGGGPIICFAAADPRIRNQVAFVALIGSYFNATSLLRAVGRRALTVNGQAQPWQPDPFPIQVLANVISGTLPPSEGPALQRTFTPSGKPLKEFPTINRGTTAQFSPGIVAAYHLLAGDEPNRVDANLAALPPQAHTLLDELSVNRVLHQIHAPIYLLHDRNDTSIPFTESLDFAAALMRIHHPYDLAEFGIFQHVQVRADLGISQLLGDAPRLFRILSEVMLPSSYPGHDTGQGQALPLHVDVGVPLAGTLSPAPALSLIILSLYWLLLGALIGALAICAGAARTDARSRPTTHPRRRWLIMLAVGALTALLGGWLGALLLGKYIATAVALWVAVLGIAVCWLLTLACTRFGPKYRHDDER